MSEKKCNYCKNGKGYHQSFEGGDWHIIPCYKCNPRSPWYKKPVKKKECTDVGGN
jgi:hypothetical protein